MEKEISRLGVSKFLHRASNFAILSDGKLVFVLSFSLGGMGEGVLIIHPDFCFLGCVCVCV